MVIGAHLRDPGRAVDADHPASDQGASDWYADAGTYIAIITEHGYNLHRHLYLGFMEKIGDYVGGEVVRPRMVP